MFHFFTTQCHVTILKSQLLEKGRRLSPWRALRHPWSKSQVGRSQSQTGHKHAGAFCSWAVGWSCCHGKTHAYLSLTPETRVFPWGGNPLDLLKLFCKRLGSRTSLKIIHVSHVPPEENVDLCLPSWKRLVCGLTHGLPFQELLRHANEPQSCRPLEMTFHTYPEVCVWKGH